MASKGSCFTSCRGSGTDSWWMWFWMTCATGKSRAWARSGQLSLRTGESVPQEPEQPEVVDIKVREPAMSEHLQVSINYLIRQRDVNIETALEVALRRMCCGIAVSGGQSPWRLGVTPGQSRAVVGGGDPTTGG